MRVVESVRELQEHADAVRGERRRLALVPTMGALHEGHLALVDAARRKADEVWVSIFVNPSQFAPGEDFERYPRTLESDLAACRDRGVDGVFHPPAQELYPPGHQTWVEVTELARPLCGARRPGHFRGVATVVAKLLIAARPHVAVFGEKDFQQLAVIRRLVRDLGLDVEILGVPIVREADGLAVSSRNRLLASEARRQAGALARALDVGAAAVAGGELRGEEILRRVRAELARAPLARVEYAELRDPETLRPAPEKLAGPTLLALAVHLPAAAGGPGASVRLIDNRLLHPHPHMHREDRS